MEGFEFNVLTAEEVARIFGCRARWAMRHYKQLGGTKIGKKTVFLKENLERALRAFAIGERDNAP